MYRVGVAGKLSEEIEGDKDWTPLHYAAGAGEKDIVELLIENGAKVKAKTEKGKIPLHIAEEKNHDDIVELLRQYEAENGKIKSFKDKLSLGETIIDLRATGSPAQLSVVAEVVDRVSDEVVEITAPVEIVR